MLIGVLESWSVAEPKSRGICFSSLLHRSITQKEIGELNWPLSICSKAIEAGASLIWI
jgi:hypothetical protein